MPDYQNSKIYAIRSHSTDLIYIGSTTQKLNQRLSKHKNDYKRKHTNISSKEILQYDDCYIELIELCPCNTKEELLKKEGEYIRKMNCVNKRIAGRTIKEWIEVNKETLKQKQKDYHEKNKEYLNKMKKIYGEKLVLCECGSEIRTDCFVRHKKTSNKHYQYQKIYDFIHS